MSEKISGSGSYSAIDRIPKLVDHEGFPAWKRAMRDCLKMIDLWIYCDNTEAAPQGI